MRIAVLISGGVDSSVALALLRDKGYAVTAFYLKIWLEDEAASLGECPWEEDLRYVRSVCEKMNVELRVIPLQKEYHERVIIRALEEVRAGRTPNPDIWCNRAIKFGAFFDAIDQTFDKIATGHYAQVEERNSVFFLKKSADIVKDQTYFLSLLTQDQISRILFPIGGYTKFEVRALAKRYELSTASRSESQGLCFLGKVPYDEFIKLYVGEKKGDIVDMETKKILGKHSGYWFYTIGQRHGLNLSGGPWYVVGKNIQKNILYVSHRLKMTESERDTFIINGVHWISMKPCTEKLSVKVRHGAMEYPCKIEWLGDDSLRIYLTEHKERGIAPGQFAVLYDKELCLGSGIIE